MPDAPLGTVLRHVRKLAAAPPGAGPSDRDLLRDFAARRDAGAFAALVRRHGPAVLGTCRRVLRHAEDAEDAFQATFLTLARKAHAIRKAEALGCWLHGVAYRMAMKAKRDAARRRQREGQARPAAPANPSWDAAWREVQALLEAEIQRLPERYRAPFVLCCLEGQSRSEAAQLLGVKEGTVWSRLAEARKRLQERLSRRGVTLAGALAAAALAPAAAQATLPPALVKATAEAAAQAAGQAGAGTVLGGVTRTMFATKCRTATTVLLAVTLVALGAGVVALRAPAAVPAPEPPPPAKAPEKAPRAAEQRAPAALDNDKGDTVTVAGQVLGPDGKPFAGAEITAWWHSHHGWVAWQNAHMHSVRPKVLGRSGPDGRFRFTFPKSDIKESLLNSDAQPWRLVEIIAAAPGHGPAWTYAQAVAQGELTLRLVKDDVPVRGRVRDLEGRPVAGASVEVVRTGELEVHSWAGLPEKITTDKEGHFTLTGVGRGRSARLLITGPAIEFKVVDVTTPAEKDARPAAPVEVVAGPTKVITGTVRALDTGKPLAGVWVYGNEHNYCNTYVVRPVRAVTDKDGRYRLVGMPKAKTYELTVYPAAGQNYLVRARTVADSEGLRPLQADFELRHGVPIAFRLIEKETGKPVRGHVQYEPTSDNSHYSEAVYGPGVIPSREFMRLRETGPDGYVRFVAYPGPCMIFAVAGRGNPPYLHGRLDPADRAKGHFPGPRGDPDNGFLDITNGYARIDYKATDEEQKFDIYFHRGRDLKGRLLGPDGRPVRGAIGYGLTRDASAARPEPHPADEALKEDAFTARGLYPKEQRTLSFAQKEKKLIGYVVVDGTEEKPVEVRLQPWGAATGRLVDGDGKALAGVKVSRYYPWLPPPGMRANGEDYVTDAEGRFRVEGLLPEQKHRLELAGPKEGVKLDAGAALKDISAPAGGVKDLGDVRVQVQTVPVKKK